MKLLGAIIAGGGSTRFGGDKGAALLGGKALIDHVAEGLRPQVDALVIVGRDWPGIMRVDDRPGPGLGPLGGLCGALHYAQANGFDAVITTGCDTLPVWQRPDTPAPGQALAVQGHFLFGLWPASLAAKLENHLATETDRSMRHWIAMSGATLISTDQRFANINTQADLEAYATSPPQAP